MGRPLEVGGVGRPGLPAKGSVDFQHLHNVLLILRGVNNMVSRIFSSVS